MDDRLSRLESTVQALEQSLRLAEHRLATLEARTIPVSASPVTPTEIPPTAPAAAVATPSAAASPELPPLVPVPRTRDDLVSILSYIGRTFVALGGAYLLRALTDSGSLPAGAGLGIGLAYGLAWLILADRAGAAGHRVSAAFDGLVSAMITLPLVWEAAIRFKFIGPEATAAALGFVTAAALAVAVHRRLHALAWIVTLAVLPEALGLIVKTTVVVPFAYFLIGLGLATLWVGYARQWLFLRWPVAITADMAVLALVLRIASGSWDESAGRVVLVQLALLTGYLVSIVVRTLVRARDVVPFEVVQTGAALAVGFGGAVYVAQHTGSGVVALALINLAFGAACYAVAFVFVAKRQGLSRNFYFYTSLALVLVLISTNLLLLGDPRALVWAIVAIAATLVARKIGRALLNLHAAVYVIAAAAASGLLTSAAFALMGPTTVEWARFTSTALAVLSAALICWVIPLPSAVDWGAYARIPRVLIAMTAIWALGGLIVGALAPALCGTPGAGADPGVVATVRTCVLSLAALALAWIGRTDTYRESSWLLYPVLIAGGAKLLFEDFPRSRPSTLFVALALYGVALIAAPRFARPPHATPQAPSAS